MSYRNGLTFLAGALSIPSRIPQKPAAPVSLPHGTLPTSPIPIPAPRATLPSLRARSVANVPRVAVMTPAPRDGVLPGPRTPISLAPTPAPLPRARSVNPGPYVDPIVQPPILTLPGTPGTPTPAPRNAGRAAWQHRVLTKDDPAPTTTPTPGTDGGGLASWWKRKTQKDAPAPTAVLTTPGPRILDVPPIYVQPAYDPGGSPFSDGGGGNGGPQIKDTPPVHIDAVAPNALNPATATSPTPVKGGGGGDTDPEEKSKLPLYALAALAAAGAAWFAFKKKKK